MFNLGINTEFGKCCKSDIFRAAKNYFSLLTIKLLYLRG